MLFQVSVITHMPRSPGGKCPLTLTMLHSHSQRISNTRESSILRLKICGLPHRKIWIYQGLIPRDSYLFLKKQKHKERVQNPLLPLIRLRSRSVIKSSIWVRKITLVGEPTEQNLKESSQVQFTHKQSEDKKKWKKDYFIWNILIWQTWNKKLKQLILTYSCQKWY